MNDRTSPSGVTASCRPQQWLSLSTRNAFQSTSCYVSITAVLFTLAMLSSTARAAFKKESKLGPVQATVELEPEEPVIGDTVTLTIRVVAEKDVEVLMPEFGEAMERFAILDFVPRQTVDDQGRFLATQVYRLQPPYSGKQTIPPILIEFVDRRPGQRQAPEGEDAYELLTERIEFEVKSVLPNDAAAELKPPLGELEPLTPPPPAKWPWIVGLIIVMAVASPFAVKAFAAWRRRRKRRSAYEIARTRLERLLVYYRRGISDVDEFYVELSGIVRRYLEDRFDMRAPELTTEEFLDAVQQSPDLIQSHQALLREFLRQADLVKFARLQPSESDMNASIDSAQRFLDETQENAPLLDVPDDELAEEAQANTRQELESETREANRA